MLSEIGVETKPTPQNQPVGRLQGFLIERASRQAGKFAKVNKFGNVVGLSDMIVRPIFPTVNKEISFRAHAIHEIGVLGRLTSMYITAPLEGLAADALQFVGVDAPAALKETALMVLKKKAAAPGKPGLIKGLVRDLNYFALEDRTLPVIPQPIPDKPGRKDVKLYKSQLAGLKAGIAASAESGLVLGPDVTYKKEAHQRQIKFNRLFPEDEAVVHQYELDRGTGLFWDRNTGEVHSSYTAILGEIERLKMSTDVKDQAKVHVLSNMLERTHIYKVKDSLDFWEELRKTREQDLNLKLGSQGLMQGDAQLPEAEIRNIFNRQNFLECFWEKQAILNRLGIKDEEEFEKVTGGNMPLGNAFAELAQLRYDYERYGYPIEWPGESLDALREAIAQAEELQVIDNAQRLGILPGQQDETLRAALNKISEESAQPGRPLRQVLNEYVSRHFKYPELRHDLISRMLPRLMENGVLNADRLTDLIGILPGNTERDLLIDEIRKMMRNQGLTANRKNLFSYVLTNQVQT